MNRKQLLLMCISMFVTSYLTSCTTMKESIGWSTLGGAVIGGTVGALVNVKYKNQTKSVVLGSSIGAAVGAGSGYLLHKYYHKKSDDQSETSNNINQGSPPRLTKPSVRRVWVDDQIDGDNYIEGHWTYVIEQQSIWKGEEDNGTQSNNKDKNKK